MVDQSAAQAAMPASAGASSGPVTAGLESRLAELEEVVASLGNFHISQEHDGFELFRAWFDKVFHVVDENAPPAPGEKEVPAAATPDHHSV